MAYLSLNLNSTTDPLQLRFRTSECRAWLRKEERKARLANWYLASTETLDLKTLDVKTELSKIRQTLERSKKRKLRDIKASISETSLKMKQNAATQLALEKKLVTFHAYKMKANALVKANMDTLREKMMAMRASKTETTIDIEEQLAASTWVDLKPERFPVEYSHLFTVQRRNENIANVPVTRCTAIFPDASVEQLKNMMCDPEERLLWDYNYAEFKRVAIPGGEDRDIFYHRVESNVMKIFGFKPRSFLYERQIDTTPTSEGDSVLVKFKSVSDSDDPSSSSVKSVRGTIHHQSYLIEPLSRGSQLIITSVVNTGSNPPSPVVNLMVKMMSGQPYIWMNNHLNKDKVIVPLIERVCESYHSAAFL